MGQQIELTAADGHRFGAYLAEPDGTPRGAVVIVQEIFGVTASIAGVADQYASAGFLAIAPSLFDRFERGLSVPYTDMARGIKLMQELSEKSVFEDLAAAVEHVRIAGKVGIVGFCWGGTLAYLGASRLPVDAAVAYYGGAIAKHLDEIPKVPVLFHFGEKDTHIPVSSIEALKSAYPQALVFMYPADHAFNNVDRESYEPASAQLAFDRSVNFLRPLLG